MRINVPPLEARCGYAAGRAQVRAAHGGAHHRPPRVVGNVCDRARGTDGRERVVHHAVESAEVRDRGSTAASTSARTVTSHRTESARARPAARSRRRLDRRSRCGAPATTTFAPADAHASAIPSPTPPPEPVTTTVFWSRSPLTGPSRSHRRPRRVPAVRKCASGTPSISISGARSVAGSPGPPSAGTDSETERVSASASSPATQWCGAAANVFAVTPTEPPLPAARLSEHAHPFGGGREHREVRAPPTCRWSARRTPLIPRVLESGATARRANHHAASMLRSQPIDPCRFVEIHERARCHERRRQPRVHHLIDPAECAFSRRDRGRRPRPRT